MGEGRLDLLVDDRLIVELKAVGEVAPIHKASGRKLALLINFKVSRLKDGIQRVVLT